MQKMIKDKLKSVYELEKVTYEKIFKHGMDYSVVIYHTYTLVDGLQSRFGIFHILHNMLAQFIYPLNCY